MRSTIRSELATPGGRPDMFQRAAACSADAVFLDLEDAVADSAKDLARAHVASALVEVDWGAKLIGVRINGLGTPYWRDDAWSVVGCSRPPDFLVVPKLGTARELSPLLDELEALERDKGLPMPIPLEILIETAAGLAHAGELAASSPRVDAITLGLGDLATDLRVRHDPPFSRSAQDRHFWSWARWQVVVAARAAKVAAMDSPYADYGNPSGFSSDAVVAREMGFDGKWAIHPTQTDLANEAFSVTSEEAEQAARIVEMYDAAKERGVGAVGVDGVLLDAANVANARSVLDEYKSMNQTIPGPIAN